MMIVLQLLIIVFYCMDGEKKMVLNIGMYKIVGVRIGENKEDLGLKEVIIY